ncbi:hypothetical protein BGZ76_011640 [Entomortierella beljakovae]|nr:hypothetical protein BGZ76_011640 [Entomortierella beljakovae]
MERVKRNEAITVPQFVTYFNYTQENDAHPAYLALLSRSSLQATVSTVRTATTLISEGEHAAIRIVKESNLSGHVSIDVHQPSDTASAKSASEECVTSKPNAPEKQHQHIPIAVAAAVPPSEPGINEAEKAELLLHINNARHVDCDEWKEETCLACLFQRYQRECVQALHDDTIKRTEIADIMAITGVFAPFLPTTRMTEAFGINTLEQLIEPIALPDQTINEAAVTKAIRHCISKDLDESSLALGGLNRRMRIMFETLLERLPMRQDTSVSEETFIVNYLSPILHATLKTHEKFSLHFPNTSSEVQKEQGLKPDRPDILLKIRGREVLFGEVTGLSQENNSWKNMWDLYRLSRYGKSFLDNCNDVAPLLQVIYTTGTYMRLKYKVRGVYLLEEVGQFTIPATIANQDLQQLKATGIYNRKRSWGFKDVSNAKKRLIKESGPSSGE